MGFSQARPSRGRVVRAFLAGLVVFPWGRPDQARSACMPSDDRVECIGVYKEWSEDLTMRDAEAAGIRWVSREREPESYEQAVASLKLQRKIVAGFEELVVGKGDSLQEVGTSLLRLRPRVTLAARFLQRRISAPAAPFFSAAVDRTLYALDTLDVAIGYALRSDDPSAFAETLTVIETLHDAEAEYETLLLFANDRAGFEAV